MYSIETDNLTKKYKNKTVVDNLNLKIKDGELFALLGTNGAGKTTTITMLTGLVKPTKGKIKILNLNLENNSQKIKTMLNISPQETAIAPNLTVKENLEFFAGVYQIKDRNEKIEKIEKLVKDFKLEKVIDEKVKKLSGGWQRRLSIALALINGPKILFLDEPTLGLDVIARKELWHIIEKLKGKITIILTTHYMEEAEALSDRIGIMKNGRVIVTGTAKSLMEQAEASTFEDAFVRIVTGEEL